MNEPATVHPIDPDPEYPEPQIERDTLRAMLEGVLITASKNKPHLAVVLFQFKRETLTLVTTDGHRLTRTQTAWLEAGQGPKETANHLIPVDRARVLLAAIKKPAISKSIREPVSFRFEEEGAYFVVELINSDEFACRSADESFPPFEKVIPAERTTDGEGCPVIGVNAKYLGDVAKAARHLAGAESVRWSVGGVCDPIRIDLENGATESTIVIMPMRV